MLPRRFKILPPYFAQIFHSRFKHPSFYEVLKYLIQPSKSQRAMKYIENIETVDGYKKILFKNIDKPFYYPENATWIDLCQTVDEVFNNKNWHHFISKELSVSSNDVIVDCGAAEGLFSFLSALKAKKIFAIEPIPIWHKSLEKTFSGFKNVEILKLALSHNSGVLKMIDNEIYSRISNDGNIDVRIDTIDRLFSSENITFIKADIEGFEFQMLLGAEDVIRKNRPKISICVYHDTNHFIEIVEYLKNIHSDYKFNIKGLSENGNPIILQAY